MTRTRHHRGELLAPGRAKERFETRSSGVTTSSKSQDSPRRTEETSEAFLIRGSRERKKEESHRKGGNDSYPPWHRFSIGPAPLPPESSSIIARVRKGRGRGGRKKAILWLLLQDDRGDRPRPLVPYHPFPGSV
ncbi:hypothetical protein KM043_018422 [Ampulex compressa]|nr:hypothetical protein KM043_018422 [Ampulex compressa]